MNLGFEKRQKLVLAVLKQLSIESKKKRQTLVFVGGSAANAILPKAKRLSIDLDVHYSGKPLELLDCLKPEYEIEARHSWDDQQFEFFTAKKDGTLVKVDFARYPISKSQYSLEKIGKASNSFTTLIGRNDYLLASKLVALSIGRLGRNPEKKDFQTDFLKDVFDADQLLNTIPITANVRKNIIAVVKTQNKLRKKKIALQKVFDSIEKALLSEVRLDDEGIVSQGVRQNFGEYLTEGRIQKPDYWRMLLRVAAFVKANQKGISIVKMEQMVDAQYRDSTRVEEWINILEKAGVNRKLLYELKNVNPQALGYYYIAKS